MSRDQGRLDEAERLYRESLELLAAVPADEISPEHFHALHALGRLGCVLVERGDLDAAETTLDEALDRQRRGFGEEHFATIRTVHCLGVLRMKQGRPDDAEPLLRDALERFQRSVGERHPLTHAVMSDLWREHSRAGPAR